jgi:hypothetical protein
MVFICVGLWDWGTPVPNRPLSRCIGTVTHTLISLDGTYMCGTVGLHDCGTAALLYPTGRSHTVQMAPRTLEGSCTVTAARPIMSHQECSVATSAENEAVHFSSFAHNAALSPRTLIGPPYAQV